MLWLNLSPNLKLSRHSGRLFKYSPAMPPSSHVTPSRAQCSSSFSCPSTKDHAAYKSVGHKVQDSVAAVALPTMPCSSRLCHRMSFEAPWCSVNLAPGFGSFSETIFRTSRPRVPGGIVKVNPAPFKQCTCRSIMGSPWPPELGDAIGRYCKTQNTSKHNRLWTFSYKDWFHKLMAGIQSDSKGMDGLTVWLLVWFAAHPSLDFDYINVMLFLEGLEGNRDEPAKAQGSKKWRSVKVEEPTSLPLKPFHVSKAILKQQGALQTNLRAQERSPVGMKTHVAM